MRSCGECEACCTELGLSGDGFSKPERTRCEHQGGGCTIYDRRPQECRLYSCGWLTSEQLFPQEKLRPDLSGVIFDKGVDQGDGVVTLVVRELTPHASDAYWVQRTIKRLRKVARIVIRSA